jgi:MerR family transcriptional regulator, heat shock protein HspR
MAAERKLRSTTRVKVTAKKDGFMISVAAELAGMHPQTLRMYETKGVIEPKRSPKGTRLYSLADVEKLKRIQAMTTEAKMSLQGALRMLELEDRLVSMSRKVQGLEARAQELTAEVERLEQLRRDLRAEIVPYVRPGALVVSPRK